MSSRRNGKGKRKRRKNPGVSVQDWQLCASITNLGSKCKNTTTPDSCPFQHQRRELTIGNLQDMYDPTPMFHAAVWIDVDTCYFLSPPPRSPAYYLFKNLASREALHISLHLSSFPPWSFLVDDRANGLNPLTVQQYDSCPKACAVW